MCAYVCGCDYCLCLSLYSTALSVRHDFERVVVTRNILKTWLLPNAMLILGSAKTFLSILPRLYLHYSSMAPPYSNGPLHGDSRRPPTYTITGLKRWSVAGKEIPGRVFGRDDVNSSMLTDPLRSCLSDQSNPRL